MNPSITAEEAKERFECSICFSYFNKPVITRCGHKFCGSCLAKSVIEGRRKCPLDNNVLNDSDVFPDNYTEREIQNTTVTCTKCNSQPIPLRDFEDHVDECGEPVSETRPGTSAEAAEVYLRKIFVSSLSKHTSSQKLKEYFKTWGPIEHAVVAKNRHTKYKRGFGFVTFMDSKTVDKVQTARPHVIDGKTVKCRRAFPKTEHSNIHNSSTVLYVPTFEVPLTPADITIYFSKFGEFNAVTFEEMPDLTNTMRKVAVIEYRDYDPVDKAILTQNHVVKNTELCVTRNISPRDLSKIESILAEKQFRSAPDNHKKQPKKIVTAVYRKSISEQAPPAEPSRPAVTSSSSTSRNLSFTLNAYEPYYPRALPSSSSSTSRNVSFAIPISEPYHRSASEQAPRAEPSRPAVTSSSSTNRNVSFTTAISDPYRSTSEQVPRAWHPRTSQPSVGNDDPCATASSSQNQPEQTQSPIYSNQPPTINRTLKPPLACTLPNTPVLLAESPTVAQNQVDENSPPVRPARNSSVLSSSRSRGQRTSNTNIINTSTIREGVADVRHGVRALRSRFNNLRNRITSVNRETIRENEKCIIF